MDLVKFKDVQMFHEYTHNHRFMISEVNLCIPTVIEYMFSLKPIKLKL